MNFNFEIVVHARLAQAVSFGRSRIPHRRTEIALDRRRRMKMAKRQVIQSCRRRFMRMEGRVGLLLRRLVTAFGAMTDRDVNAGAFLLRDDELAERIR